MFSGARMLHRQPIGYGLKPKAGIAGESGLNIGVREEAVVGVVAVEEGDLDAGKTKKFGELEHGVDVSLDGEREDEDMRSDRALLIQ